MSKQGSSTRLRREQIAAITIHAAANGMTVSEFIREGVDLNIARYDRKLRKQVADRVALEMQKEQVRKVFLLDGASDD
jgi:hypothetical protein